MNVVMPVSSRRPGASLRGVGEPIRVLCRSVLAWPRKRPMPLGSLSFFLFYYRVRNGKCLAPVRGFNWTGGSWSGSPRLRARPPVWGHSIHAPLPDDEMEMLYSRRDRDSDVGSKWKGSSGTDK